MWQPVAVLFALTLSSTAAYACLDPGAGSLLVHAPVAGPAGGRVVFLYERQP